MMRIQFIGVGGVGSALVSPIGKFLRYYQDSPVQAVFVDGDKVEDTNLARQVFVTEDVNRFKADVMAEYFRTFFENHDSKHECQIEAVTEYLRPENVADVIQEGSITFCGVDNFVTRKLIEDRITELQNARVFFGANDYHDGDVNYVEIRDGELVTPLYSDKHPEIKERDQYPFELSCADETPSEPQLIFANETAARFMINGFYQVLEGTMDWHEIFFDVKTGNVRKVKVES